MKPRVIASVLLCSATLLSVAAPSAVQASVTSPVTTAATATKQATLPSSFADFQIGKSTVTDAQNQFKSINTIGQPKVTSGTGLKAGKQVINFDGKSAYSMPVSQDQYKQIGNGMAIETFFRWDPQASTSGEHDILSNQNSGGVGMGIVNGQVNFFAHVDGTYKQPKGALKPGRWVHAVGVIDDKAKTVSLYLNGKLSQSIKVTNTQLKLAQGKGANHFVLGGDSADNFKAESLMTGEVKTARIYNHALSAADVQNLNDTAQADVLPTDAVEQAMESRFVGANDVVAGHTYDLNVHTRQVKAGDVDEVSYEVHYDPTRFLYRGANQRHSGVTITTAGAGTLKITDKGSLSSAGFGNYGQTRLAKIQLQALAVADGTNEATKISFSHGATSMNGTPIENPQLTFDGDKTVTVHGKKTADYNGDGIIGAGDIALAPADKQAEVAQQAVIRPYKHVIVLTTDGGGNPWDPSGMYYAEGDKNDHRPVWTTNPSILKKRENTYTMDLFNKQFAMSTTAEAVQPTISAQNYISMLHGLTWGDLPAEYQATNATSGSNYFADFDKTAPKYPSVFKAIQAENPTQAGTAFSEWGNILNGIIEPTAAVSTRPSSLKHSFTDVANYIGQKEFNNTAMTFVQTDYMDHIGHSTGFYNSRYWHEYAAYDGLFKGIMDKLEATGHIHDTLVIANADHGGVYRDHGQDATTPNTNIFMALGGETIDNGRRLKGGSNSDISALALHALQIPKPASMTGKVFDSSAFLDQTELVKKHRDVETITLKQNGNHADLSLGNLQHQVRTADLRIDLAGRSLSDIKLPNNGGAKILRQSVKDGILTLTMSFANQPTSKAFATLKFDNGNATVNVKQAMVGADDGTEILVDLLNPDYKPDQTPDNNNKPDQKPGDANKPNQKPDNKPGQKPGDANKPNQKPDNKPGQKPGDANKPDQKPDKPGQKPGDANKPNQKPDKPGQKPGDANKPNQKPGDSHKPGHNHGNSDNTNGHRPGHHHHSEDSNQTDQGTDQNTDQNNNTDNNQPAPQPAPDQSHHHGHHHHDSQITNKLTQLYAKGRLGFYKTAHFTKHSLLRWFKTTKQQLWPSFSVLKTVHTKDGYRYKVRDLNQKSKTFNQTGYITTNKKLVTSSDYTTKVTRVQVIASKGINGYDDQELTQKATHYRTHANLNVKRIVKVGDHVRLQLASGHYITADKHQIKALNFAHTR